MAHHKDLDVWKKSMDLVDSIYDLTQEFSADERFGLTSQMRRCSVSIPSNIAEGFARNNTGELKQFLGIARGSLAELETQCLICIRRGFIAKEDVESLMDMIDHIGKMLFKLKQSLK